MTIPRYPEDEYFANPVDISRYNRIIERYSSKDVIVTAETYLLWHFGIAKVIFNDPATIVFWFDGTKTVVKCGPTEMYDSEKGLAMAIAKRALGDSGKYYDTFKKFLPKADEKAVLDAFKKSMPKADEKAGWVTLGKILEDMFKNKKDQEDQ